MNKGIFHLVHSLSVIVCATLSPGELMWSFLASFTALKKVPSLTLEVNAFTAYNSTTVWLRVLICQLGAVAWLKKQRILHHDLAYFTGHGSLMLTGRLSRDGVRHRFHFTTAPCLFVTPPPNSQSVRVWWRCDPKQPTPIALLHRKRWTAELMCTLCFSFQWWKKKNWRYRMVKCIWLKVVFLFFNWNGCHGW